MEARFAPPPTEINPPAEPVAKNKAEIAAEKRSARNSVLYTYDIVYGRLKNDTVPLIEKLKIGDPITDEEKQQIIDYHVATEGIKSANKKNNTSILGPDNITGLYGDKSNVDVIQEFGHEGRAYTETEGLPVEPLLRQLQRERQERLHEFADVIARRPNFAKIATQWVDESEAILREHAIPFAQAHAGNEQYMRDRQQYEALLAHIDDISGHKLRNTGSPEGDWASAEKALAERVELQLPPPLTEEEMQALRAKEKADWEAKKAEYRAEREAAGSVSAESKDGGPVERSTTESVATIGTTVTPEAVSVVSEVTTPPSEEPEDVAERESRVQRLLKSKWAKRSINPISIGLIGMTIGSAVINRDTIDFVPSEKPAAVAVGGHPYAPPMPDVRFPVAPDAAFTRTVSQIEENPSVIEKQETAEQISGMQRDVDPYLPKQGGSVEGYVASKLVQELYPAEVAALPRNPDGSIKSDDPEFQRLAETISEETIKKVADAIVADINAENPESGWTLVGPDPANPTGRVFHIEEAQTIALKPTEEYIKGAGIQMPVSSLPTAGQTTV